MHTAYERGEITGKVGCHETGQYPAMGIEAPGTGQVRERELAKKQVGISERLMSKFQRYIGIDYSGAKTPEWRIKDLQIFEATCEHGPEKVTTSTEGAKNWNRQEVTAHCLKALEGVGQVIIGIDHGFAFPLSYIRRYRLTSWDDFLHDFIRHWPTADPDTYVEFLREGNQRTGDPSEFRLCELWTATAKSVFQFDVQGTVSKSTHAGLPWLLWLREAPTLQGKVHFWPFDGFDIPVGKSVIAEVYPSLYRRRYPKDGRTADEHDAFSVAGWMRDADRHGVLDKYFTPPLTSPERNQVKLEGWILGVW